MSSTQQQQLRNRILIRDRDSTNQKARDIGGQRVSFVYKREFAHEPRQYAVPLPSSSPSPRSQRKTRRLIILHAVFDERGCTYREDRKLVPPNCRHGVDADTIAGRRRSVREERTDVFYYIIIFMCKIYKNPIILRKIY